MLEMLNDPVFWILLAIWPASAVLHVVLVVFWINPFIS
jgi:hypothetical protein